MTGKILIVDENLDDPKHLEAFGSEVEESLRSASLLRATLESAPGGSFVLDREGRSDDCNERLKKTGHISVDVIVSHGDKRALARILKHL